MTRGAGSGWRGAENEGGDCLSYRKRAILVGEKA